MAVRQLRGAWRRSLAAGLTICLAVGSFVVLTGTVTAQRLQVTEQVQSNFRSTYDILARPAGSRADVELAEGLVRPNFLSGQFGGITLEQVDRIAAIPDVEIAAPVAVLGQTMRNIALRVKVADVLGDRPHAMVRFSLDGAARNSTARSSNQHGYLYLTRSALKTLDERPSGEKLPDRPAQVEQRGKSHITACLASDAGAPAADPSQEFVQQCWSAVEGSTAPQVEVLFSMPLTVQAIDPMAESRLTGLGESIVAGRNLDADDGYSTDNNGPAPIEAATAVMADKLPLDFQATLSVEALSEATISHVLGTTDAALRRELVVGATPTETVGTMSVDAADLYRRDILPDVDTRTAVADQSLIVLAFTQPGNVDYPSSDPLKPSIVPFAPDAWRSQGDGFLPAPSSIVDTGYRSIVRAANTGQAGFLSFKVVGTYDPDRIPRPSNLNEVPLETYRPSAVAGADQASRSILGNRPLRSDLSPSGYLQSPPAILVPLKSLPMFFTAFPTLNAQAPVSSVRVRVAGITGLDAASREKIRLVAERIQAVTGLDVDITIGASLQNRLVELPASAAGTPALRVNEQWTKKGVALAITQALDVKSLALFLLILASSAFTLALIASAAVATRRREFAILSAVGWPSRRLAALITTELLILGVAAGTVGGLAAVPIAWANRVEVVWWQIVLAPLLGGVLALLPGLAAALRAGATIPMDALVARAATIGRPPVVLRGPASLAVIMISRRFGRFVLGVAAVTVAVASTILLATIIGSFNGSVIGSFLGDAVALQVRAPDIAATVILGLLGLIAIATMLGLNLIEDAPTYAALSATGWSDRNLAMVVVTQSLLTGLVGSLIGAAVALGLSLSLLGMSGPGILNASALVIAATGALSVGIALLPAVGLRRLPVARILARDE